MTKLYDLIIIGSGPICAGILHGIPDNLSIAVITHGGYGGYEVDVNGDLTYANRFGGGLDEWHGVSSLALYKKHYPSDMALAKEFFSEIYMEREEICECIDESHIYIPNKKIDLHNLVELIESLNCDVIVGNVDSVNLESFYAEAIIGDARFRAKKIILAAGAIGSMRLLSNSGLGTPNAYIGNHINGYCNFNVKPPEGALSIKRGKGGHAKPIVSGILSGHEYIQYHRPSLFDFRYKDMLIKNKSTYSRSKSEVYSKILRAMSPGLISEAIYNRYGYWIGGSNSNVYYQIESTNVYYYDHQKKLILVDQNNLKSFNHSLKSDFGFKQLCEETIVSGIHFYNSVNPVDGIGIIANKESWSNTILVADSSCLKSIGGAHHTFSIMAMGNLAARRIYE